MPAVESGEAKGGTPCLIWEDARVLPYKAWEEMGRMWCHTRVQGFASVPKREFGGRFERETGGKDGKWRGFCEHFGERVGSEEFPKGKSRVLLHRSEQLDGEAGIGVETPYRTTPYRT